MKRCIAVVIVSIVALSIPVAHAGDQPANVKKMLERLAGRWTWTGQQANIGAENSPYGQAGRFVGSGEGRLIMDGQFILDEYQEKSPEGNVMHGVSLISYDPVKKCFVSRDCMSDGSTSVAEFTIEGRTRKDQITITSKTGEILLARVMGEYSRDWKRLEATWEGSTDNGKTWKHWCSLVSEKTGDGDNDEQELIRLQQEWVRAELNRDAAALGRLLADEYALTAPDGTVITRDQLISQNQSDDGFHVTSIPADNLTVQIFGNMGLVKGLVNGTDGKGKNVQSYFTDTWLKRDGRWVCLATHESAEQEIVAPEKTPGYQKMKRLIGDWTYEGNVDPQWKDTPFGPTGKFKGEFRARFVLNGNFVEEHWQETYEAGGALGGITIYRYDSDTGNIVSRGFLSDGTQDNTVYTIDGDTLTGNSKQTGADGKESLIKAVWKYGPNHDTFTSTWKLSLDEGKTWKLWLTYDAKKKK